MSEHSPHQKHLAQAKALDHNRHAWDQLVAGQRRFTRPANDEDLKDPLCTVDAIGWLGGDIRQQQVLCLAAGGGRQSAIYAAAGAHVTVVDLSPAMLELDRQVAAERGFSIQIVESSMDNLSAFSGDTFDIVIHPVSTCYLPDIQPVFQEVARVIRPEGIYISQHKQPTSLQTNMQRSANGWELVEPYYRDGALPAVDGSRLREEGTWEYLHRWEEILGGICRAGFVIEDFIEPLHADSEADEGSFGDRCRFTAPYMRIKARRHGEHNVLDPKSPIVIPD